MTFSLCLSLLYFVVPSFAQDAPKAESTLHYLQQKLPPDLSVFRKGGEVEFQFCPENSCDVIKAHATPEKGAELALLYFVYMSEWIDDGFEKFKEAAGPRSS
jgi:hypothetical protein